MSLVLSTFGCLAIMTYGDTGPVLIWLQRTSHPDRRCPDLLRESRSLLRVYVVNQGIFWPTDYDDDPVVGTDDNKDKRRLLRGWPVELDAGRQSPVCIPGAHGYDCQSPGLGWLDDPVWMNVSG